MLSFEQPIFLLLLVLVGAFLFWTWRRLSLPYPKTQKRFIIFTRIMIFVLVIMALAGSTWHWPSGRQATIFVGDISASTRTQQSQIEDYIRSALQNKRSDDLVGVVATGRNALVEQSLTTNLDFAHFTSTPDTNYTDLAAGLRLAAAILPSDVERHIILLSDGLQNLGDALQEAQLLRQQGIRLDVVALPNITSQEARIDDFQAPSQLRTGERFMLHIQLFSTINQVGTLRLYLDQTLINQRDITLAPGITPLDIQLPAPAVGTHTYHITLEAPQDSLPQNNQASAFVNVQGPPVVFVVEGQPGNGANIIASLQATGMNVEHGTANDLPNTLEEMSKYSSVVLVDTPALALGNARMQLLQSFVRDLGHGLLVSGGQNSYGIGGYANTPLEETLPVKMDIPQHKDTPDIAVVLIIESLEAQLPVNISKEAAKGVVSLLTARDQIAISSAYGNLDLPMQHVTDKEAINKFIDAMNPNDPPGYGSDLIAAEQALLQTDAKIKHIILLGDGDAQADNYAPIVQKIASENITVSVVETNALNAGEIQTMANIANWGKGRFYRAEDHRVIPEILLEETQRAAKRSIINERFIPAQVGSHPIMNSFTTLPNLDGYIATTPKPAGQVVLTSHLDDPILAVWQYGLGRVAAWTSDALGLWTSNWLRWNESARWWANIVNWTLPPPESLLHISGKFINTSGQLTVDIPNAPGANSGGQQQVQATIIAPDLSTQHIDLQPTAPERWQGSFSATQLGSYLIQVSWGSSANGDKKVTATTGLVMPYSPEFRTSGIDDRFLAQLANSGGGIVLNINDTSTAFKQTLEPVTQSIPLTFWLLGLAALLLPIDVGLRRLSGIGFLVEAWQWLTLHTFQRRQLAKQKAVHPKLETTVSTPLAQMQSKREDRRQRLQSQQTSPTQNNKKESPNLKTTTATSPDKTTTEPKTSTAATLLANKRQKQK